MRTVMREAAFGDPRRAAGRRLDVDEPVRRAVHHREDCGGDAEAVRQALESLCARGTLVKRRGRYLLVKPDGEKK